MFILLIIGVCILICVLPLLVQNSSGLQTPPNAGYSDPTVGPADVDSILEDSNVSASDRSWYSDSSSYNDFTTSESDDGNFHD